jgi:hypothetical protein
MVESRGGETGGLTLVEALGVYEARGYLGQFGDTSEGKVRCFTCGSVSSSEGVHVDARLRIEGASDPADESIVCAVQCPNCSARGTLVLPFGSRVRFHDAAALSTLDNAEKRTMWPRG